MVERKQNLERRMIRRIRALSARLLPQRTGVKPVLRYIPGVKAVLFDVYGTMLISASRDVGGGNRRTRNKALKEALRAVGLVAISRSALREGLDWLDRAIAEAHRSLSAMGYQHPEVDIREIWRKALKTLKTRGMIAGSVDRGRARALAVEYECRVNPVWPMPELRRTLKSLRRAGVVLGIVSNAQFYTSLILQSFPETGWSERWFDRRLCVWSYRLRKAKPSPHLLAKALTELRTRRGIRPEEVLCVGNDMLNDILPAAKAGCHTALFAGDHRSYRPRRTQLAGVRLRPDAVVLTLSQLAKVVIPQGRAQA